MDEDETAGIDEVLPPQPSPEIFSEEATEASEAAEEDHLGGGKEVSGSSRRDYLRGEPWEVVDEDTDADTDFFKDASSFKDYNLNDHDLKAYGSSLMSQRWRLRGEEEEGEQVHEDWSADWGGGGVTLEEDLKVLPTLRPGACSDTCCELPVGDEECAKNVETGLKLIQSFKDMGITFGNVLSYNALLDICSLAANLQTPVYANYAISLLDMMRSNNVAPNVDSYSAVVRACSQSREGIVKALVALHNCSRAGFELPVKDYHLLFDACAKEAQQGNSVAVEQGFAVLEAMKHAHLVPDPNRCLAMISVMPRDGAMYNFCREKVVEIMKEAGVDSQSVRRATELVRLLNTGRCPEDEQRSHNSTQLNYNRL